MDLLSASQIKVYRECQRKWGWKYIAGLPDPAGPAAALGTEVDDEQLQPYLRDGRTFDYSRASGSGDIAASGLAFLPRPQSLGLEVQKYFEMPSPTWVDGQHVGFGYRGYIDLWMPKGGMPGIEGGPAVCDFKTTGNWKYAKTAEGLKTDVQAQLYATWAMWSTGARVIDLVWIYMATRGPRKAKRVHLRVLAADVAEQFSAINDTALEMYAARKSVTDPLELEPNVDMCEAYGGCPFRSKCNLSPSQFIDSQAAKHRKETTMTTMSVLAALKAKRAAALGYELSPQQTDGQAAADKGVEAVGINPPEKDLPPAPPVGVVANPPPSVLEEPAKKRGRPAGSKNAPKDPVGADAAAYTGSPPAPDATVPAADEASRHQRIGALVIELASLLGIAS